MTQDPGPLIRNQHLDEWQKHLQLFRTVEYISVDE